jgi:hypothetical protein
MRRGTSNTPSVGEPGRAQRAHVPGAHAPAWPPRPCVTATLLEELRWMRSAWCAQRCEWTVRASHAFGR